MAPSSHQGGDRAQKYESAHRGGCAGPDLGGRPAKAALPRSALAEAERRAAESVVRVQT